MLEAYHCSPPMTYFSKNKEPTSRIDLAFVSAGMGRFAAATATKPAGISATHAALGLSFLDDIHRVGPQRLSHPQAHDHAIAYMASGQGRTWTLNDRRTAK